MKSQSAIFVDAGFLLAVDGRHPDRRDFVEIGVSVDFEKLIQGLTAWCVLLVRRAEDHQYGRWALPGTFLRERETLADAVLRCLREKAGISGRVPRQLQVFDDPARDDRGWVLSVAHVDVVPLAALEQALESDGVRLASVTGEPQLIAGLPYGHADIVVHGGAGPRSVAR